MTKYTKRQYNKDIAANEVAILENKTLLESFNARVENGESVNDMSDAWNAAHDREYELEGERADMDRRFRTRNWTWQDHSFASLVLANID